MSAPNLDDPLDQEIADFWKKDPEAAIKKAREWTITYANQWSLIKAEEPFHSGTSTSIRGLETEFWKTVRNWATGIK